MADAVSLAKSRVAEGKATPDQLWDAAPDVTHPGDAGYALYAEAAWQTLQQAIGQKAQCRIPEAMIYADTYMSVNRFKLAPWKRCRRVGRWENPLAPPWPSTSRPRVGWKPSPSLGGRKMKRKPLNRWC